MPSPTFTELCNTLQRSVHDLFKHNHKGSDVSAYFAAIQSLKEKSPGGKHAELNAMCRKVVSQAREKHELVEAREYRDVPTGFVPLVRINIGRDLKVRDLVAEGLQSDDAHVRRQALKARWFFHGANDHVNARYFAEELLPRASLKTRRAVIGNLARSLVGYQNKAQEFYDTFYEVYGLETSLPFLNACSEDFIYDKIIKHRIVLPVNMVNLLYKKYPNLVIKYLYLGDKNNKDNEEDRKYIEISINNYEYLIPKLLNKHPQDFAKLFEISGMTYNDLKLGTAKTVLFLKNLKNVLLEKPEVFFEILHLQTVSSILNKEEFEEVFEKLFLKFEKLLENGVLDYYHLNDLIDYLQFYRHGDKLQLLKDKYKKVYNVDFPLEKYFVKESSKLVEILPNDEKQRLAEILLEKYKNNSNVTSVITSYLPPEKLLTVLKEKIKHMNYTEDRSDAFCQMIKSCKIYNSKNHLLDVLNSYKIRHKNEQSSFHDKVLEKLHYEFGLKNLEDGHYEALLAIINHLHVKNELSNVNAYLIENVLEEILRHYLIHRHEDLATLENLYALILHCKIESSYPTWNMLKDDLHLEKNCLEKLLSSIPIKYPESHTIWENDRHRLTIILNIVEAITDYNQRHLISKLSKKSKKNLKNLPNTQDVQMKIENYPWLKKSIEDICKRNSGTSYRKNKLLTLLKKNFPELCASSKIIDNCITEDEFEFALITLRREPKKILSNWDSYLSRACAQLDKGNKPAKRFISATKWYSDIPVRFVEACLQRVKEPGYMVALGLLLDGELLEKMASTLLSTNGSTKENFSQLKQLLEAVRYVNPPVSLELISNFCQPDYGILTESALSNVANRVPVDRVLAAAKDLSNNASISVKKQGIRLYCKAATLDQLSQFLKTYRSEENTSLKFVVAKMAMKVFEKQPSPKTWDLVKDCIMGFNTKDKDIIESVFSDLEKVDVAFLSEYIEVYFSKLDSLVEDGFNVCTRNECVCLIIETLNARRTSFVSEDVLVSILKRNFFALDFYGLSRAVQRFGITVYLLSAKENFEFRRKVIEDIFAQVMEQFDKPHPEKSWCYPANNAIREFFEGIMSQATHWVDSSRKLQMIESAINLFNSTLKPWQEPNSYINLNLYKEFLLSNSPREFGARCAQRVPAFIEEFSATDVIIDYTVKLLSNLVFKKITSRNMDDYSVGVIEGLLQDNNYYGCLISAVFLSSIKGVNDKYNKIIEVLRRKEDKSIQFYLYDYLNQNRCDTD